MVLAGIVSQASQYGLGPGQILLVIPLLIPSTLPYTIPTTTLFAACVVYGRLAHDNEIIAVKAAGINILKVVWPVVVLGLVTSAATMGMYYRFIPETHHLLRSMFLNDVEEFLYAMLKKDGEIKTPGLRYAMWVHRVQGRRLLDALFKRLDEKGHYDVIARASEAELRYDPNRHILLVHMRHGELYSEGSTTRVHFEYKVWEVPLPGIDVSKKRTP